jgi:hypothetical protein
MRRRRTPGEALRFLRESAFTYEGDECLIWPFNRDAFGYARMHHEGRPQFVHRLICEAANGPAPTPKHEAAHSCGRGAEGCCTKRHLSWKTRKENEADKLIHNTHSRGERCVTAKLTEAQVLEIRALEGKARRTEMAARYGVTSSPIGAILRGQNWGWL